MREPVTVVAARRDKRQLRLQCIQVQFRPGLAAAVMRQLEQADLPRQARGKELLEPGRAEVTGQQGSRVVCSCIDSHGAFIPVTCLLAWREKLQHLARSFANGGPSLLESHHLHRSIA